MYNGLDSGFLATLRRPWSRPWEEHRAREMIPRVWRPSLSAEISQLTGRLRHGCSRRHCANSCLYLFLHKPSTAFRALRILNAHHALGPCRPISKKSTHLISYITSTPSISSQSESARKKLRLSIHGHKLLPRRRRSTRSVTLSTKTSCRRRSLRDGRRGCGTLGCGEWVGGCRWGVAAEGGGCVLGQWS